MDFRSPLYKRTDYEPMIVMGDDPRLPAMPKRPTLLDFFQHRFDPIAIDHMLQSARLALINGLDEKTITACLLHDVAVCGFIRSDHGYWGCQMIEPYVEPEIAWAVRTHQALRFYPDEQVGYTYPQAYIDHFGSDYEPDDYIRKEYEAARNHPWYMTSRMITVFDVYSFDPDITVSINDFTDILGRNFHEPEDGLGFDNSCCGHLWRTIIRPNRFL